MKLRDIINQKGNIEGEIIAVNDFSTTLNPHCAMVISENGSLVGKVYELHLAIYDPAYKKLPEELSIQKINDIFIWREDADEKCLEIIEELKCGRLSSLHCKDLMKFNRSFTIYVQDNLDSKINKLEQQIKGSTFLSKESKQQFISELSELSEMKQKLKKRNNLIENLEGSKKKLVETIKELEENLEEVTKNLTSAVNSLQNEKEKDNLLKEIKNLKASSITAEQFNKQEDDPEDYLRPFDIIKRLIVEGSSTEKIISKWHFAIYLGNRKVCNFSGDNYPNYWVKIDEWKTFIYNQSEVKCYHSFGLFKDHPLMTKHLKKCLENKYGEGKFNPYTNNCEHFVNIIVYGLSHSEQIGTCLNTIINWCSSSTIPPIVRYMIEYMLEIENSKKTLKVEEDFFDNLEKKSELKEEEKKIFENLQNQIEISAKKCN